MFDTNGSLSELSATRDDGATATLATTGATTELIEDQVTVTIPSAAGTRILEGTLSAGGETITAFITQELDLGDLEAILPGGELALERISAADPCENVTCDSGEQCEDGECAAVDLCEGVSCDPGEACVEGVCVAPDSCEGVTCLPGESCVDGVCTPETTDPDPMAGEAFYIANNCGVCHGADGSGPPSLIGVDSTTIFDKLSGTVAHFGGATEGATEADAANLAAWLATQ